MKKTTIQTDNYGRFIIEDYGKVLYETIYEIFKYKTAYEMERYIRYADNNNYVNMEVKHYVFNDGLTGIKVYIDNEFFYSDGDDSDYVLEQLGLLEQEQQYDTDNESDDDEEEDEEMV